MIIIFFISFTIQYIKFDDIFMNNSFCEIFNYIIKINLLPFILEM
jgi:hypothetical protein